MPNNPNPWPPEPQAGEPEGAKPAELPIGKVSIVAGRISLGLVSTLVATFAVWMVYAFSTPVSYLNPPGVVNLASLILVSGSVTTILTGIVAWKTIAGRVAFAISIFVLIVSIIVYAMIGIASI